MLALINIKFYIGLELNEYYSPCKLDISLMFVVVGTVTVTVPAQLRKG